MKTASVESIARICHDANKSYCESLGDKSQTLWICSPKEMRQSAIEGVESILKNPDQTPEQSHEQWAKFKIEHGWKYGEKKNPAKKEHPCLIPYAKLPDSHKMKDFLFRAIVRSFLEFEREG